MGVPMIIRSILTAALSAGLIASASAAWSAPTVKKACEADFAKLCPNAPNKRGATMRCVKTRLDQVSPNCSDAVKAAQARNAAKRAAKLATRESKGQTPTAN
ncbi:MAG: hypothetical protein ACREEH_01585 [Caulobacteraceae bacterium]